MIPLRLLKVSTVLKQLKRGKISTTAPLKTLPVQDTVIGLVLMSVGCCALPAWLMVTRPRPAEGDRPNV